MNIIVNNNENQCKCKCKCNLQWLCDFLSFTDKSTKEPEPSPIKSEIPEIIPEILPEDIYECSICLNNIHPKDEDQIVLKCSHIFHTCCIFSWQERRNLCPLCNEIIEIKE